MKKYLSIVLFSSLLHANREGIIIQMALQRELKDQYTFVSVLTTLSTIGAMVCLYKKPSIKNGFFLLLNLLAMKHIENASKEIAEEKKEELSDEEFD